MPLSGHTTVSGIIGAPVAHSRSPAIFNAAYEALGLDWVYVAFPVPPGAVRDALVGLRSLGIASRAYAAAQTTTSTNGLTGGESTSVTGNRGAYVLGQAAAGATDEVTNWVLSRLKSSFDAVVTPAGQKVVVHLDQEIAIDKAPLGRRLDHRRSQKTARVGGTGAQYGLD